MHGLQRSVQATVSIRERSSWEGDAFAAKPRCCQRDEQALVGLSIRAQIVEAAIDKVAAR